MTVKGFILVLLTTVAVLAVGCKEQLAPAQDGSSARAAETVKLNLPALPSVAGGGAAGMTENNVYRFTDMAVIGTSKLVRTDNNVKIKIRANGLEPGAYTMWWIPVNAWENCGTSPCGGADFGNPAIQWDAGYAAGVIVGPNGRINITASLNEGDTDGFFFGLGMMDSRNVEMHAILRYHGAKLPGMIGEQIHSFNEGCNPDCVDVAGTNHLP